MENKNINLIPAVFTLVISIWAIGRSGIASSVVLLLGLLFVRLRAKQKYIYILIISLFIAYLFRDTLFRFAIDYVKVGNAIDLYLAREVTPSERMDSWAYYFNNLDIFRLIFGVNVHTDPWPERELLAYNYHNSFINLHLQTGFMGLITIALIIFSLFNFYRTKQVFLFLFLTVILRWSTDLGIFFDSFDFIPFFFIFYYLRRLSFPSSSFSISSIGSYQRTGPGKLA